MHALPSHPRHPLLVGAAALLVALVVMALAATDLSSMELPVLGGGHGDAVRVEQALPAGSRIAASPQPTWVDDPLAQPLEALARPR